MQTFNRVLIAAAVLAGSACDQRKSGATQSPAASSTTVIEHSQSPHPLPSDSTAIDVIRHYYSAINAGAYGEAYALWSESGESSGKSEADFAAGFAKTASARVTIGDSVRLEGAAGSQFATVPVTVDATLRDGERQHFIGTYTLRRAMVDGATPEQRKWRIFSAKLK